MIGIAQSLMCLAHRSSHTLHSQKVPTRLDFNQYLPPGTPQGRPTQFSDAHCAEWCCGLLLESQHVASVMIGVFAVCTSCHIAQPKN